MAGPASPPPLPQRPGQRRPAGRTPARSCSTGPPARCGTGPAHRAAGPAPRARRRGLAGGIPLGADPPRLRRRPPGLRHLVHPARPGRPLRAAGPGRPAHHRDARRRRRPQLGDPPALGAVVVLPLHRRPRPARRQPRPRRPPPRGRPRPHPTVGPSREQARALVAAADADPGPQAARSAALVRLLPHNGLRVDELVSADVADLGTRPGTGGGPDGGGRVSHRVLGIVRKGGRDATVALAPATVGVLEAYLTQRVTAAGVERARLTGPLLATRTGRRLTQKAVWELIRRLPVPPASARGRSFRRTRCATPPSPSPSMPARASATSRTSPGTATPHHPPLRPHPRRPRPLRRLHRRQLARLSSSGGLQAGAARRTHSQFATPWWPEQVPWRCRLKE